MSLDKNEKENKKGREGVREMGKNAASTTQRTRALSPVKTTALNNQLQRSSRYLAFRSGGEAKRVGRNIYWEEAEARPSISQLMQTLDLGEREKKRTQHE